MIHHPTADILNTLRLVLLGFGFASHAAAANAAGDGTPIVALPAPSLQDLASMPANLARWHNGAAVIETSTGERIDYRSPDRTPAKALVGEDDSQGYELHKDSHVFVLDLGEPYLLDRFNIPSFGAKGSASLAVSSVSLAADSPRWQTVTEAIPFAPEQAAVGRFPIVEARYVKLSLAPSAPGLIGSLALQGQPTMANRSYNPVPALKSKPLEPSFSAKPLVEFNFASASSGSMVSFVNSGSLADSQRMVDDDLLTSYAFDATIPEAVLLIDLAHSTTFEAVSSVLSAGPGTLEIFAFNELPPLLADASAKANGDGGKPPAPFVVQLPTGFFDQVGLLRRVVFEEATPRTRVAVNKQNARYILMRWIAKPHAPGQEPKPIRIFEIAVLGKVPIDEVLPPGLRNRSVVTAPASVTIPGTGTIPRIPPASP